MGTSLVVQWLGLFFYFRGSIPGQGTKRSHMPDGVVKNIKRERERWKRRGEERREGGGDWPREEIRLQIDFR